MAKMALAIGVSDYEPGLTPLPGATRDVEAIQRVLQHPDMGGFDDVKTLLNPEPLVMQEAIETLFSGRTKDDLVLLFFSGHGVKDDNGKLHLATRITRKTHQGELIRATAVPASFLQDIMSNSRSRRQVVILDCCFSGAFAEGWLAKDDGSVDVKKQLGGEGRAVLTSSTSTQYSFEQEGSDLSTYTHYLVEGIETGAADLDSDGVVSIDELHEYAKGKVQEAAPAMKPEIYAVKEGYKIHLAQAPTEDPKLRYRKEVEHFAIRGMISVVGRNALDALRDALGLKPEVAAVIEDEVLKPYQEYQKKLQRYEQVLVEAIQREHSLSSDTQNELKRLQRVLNLRDEDIAQIEAQFISQKKAIKPSGVPGIAIQAQAHFHNQLDESKSESWFTNIGNVKIYWFVCGAAVLVGVAGFLIYTQTTWINPKYALLQSLLQEGKFNEADDETARIMEKVAGKQREEYLKEKDFEKLPCPDLVNIDKLWMKNSQDQFGFSVQRRIWQSSDVNNNLQKFAVRVGWAYLKEDGSFIYIIPNKNIPFKLSNPPGQLPWAVTLNGGNHETRKSYMSRIIYCIPNR
ncbi:GUN4 domain-containing protein [Nostoc sp. LEGE 06077]|uniref:caspase, EACC1-associated type n=1 Tax=Nostoc sp. LEGE 06077 TaxID=915325 RepID=UPI001880B13A|nr:GUN4 domain-containing protein [Nostoc sp. LEGE 06077]MBE9205184.1 GUN4 domain-containing protein [Nostoc sp. LEGE 06077]